MQRRFATVAVSIVTLIFISLGLHHVISPFELNRCKMTFSRPSYSRIEVNSEYEFETFKYRNGGTFSSKQGVPVVFVPGHKGEFTQVRSLGSVADKLQTDKIQLEYYTIDFKDSLSGVVGFQTIDQAKYLNDVLRDVSSRYKSNTPILIVAHSMGGFVARAAYTMSNFNVTNVETIVTLSAPHVQAPVGTDRVLNRLYDRVNTIWNKVVNANNTAHQSQKLKAMRKVSIVSIAGGSRDPLVPTPLTDVVRSELTSPKLGLSIMSSRVRLSEIHFKDPAIRRASQDHLSILWCNQLLHPITEYLYQVASDPSSKKNALRKFIPRSSMNNTIRREANEVLGNEARRRERALMKKRGIREALSFASARTLRNNLNLIIATWFALCLFHLASLLYLKRGSGRTIASLTEQMFPSIPSMTLKSAGLVVLGIATSLGWAYHNLKDDTWRGYAQVRNTVDTLICTLVVTVMMNFSIYSWSLFASLKRWCCSAFHFSYKSACRTCVVLFILCLCACHVDLTSKRLRSVNLSREFACLVLSSLTLELFTILFTGLYVTSRDGISNKISYLVLLVMCNAPMLLLSLGTAIQAFDIAFERRHIVSPGDSNWDFIYTAVLHIVPTLNMLLEMKGSNRKEQKQAEHAQALVVSSSRAIFCETCMCPTAQFERIEAKSDMVSKGGLKQKEIVFADGEVVIVGSTYRIVWCECEKFFRERSLWCKWCRHRAAMCTEKPYRSNRTGTEQGRVQTLLSMISIGACAYVIFYARTHLHLCRDAVFVYSFVSMILKFYPGLASYIL